MRIRLYLTLILVLHFTSAGLLAAQSSFPEDDISRPNAVQSDSQKVDRLVKLGQQSLERGKIDSARNFFGRALRWADSANFEYGRQKALYGMGDFYLVQQKYDSAETVLANALDMQPGPPLLTALQNLLATAYRYQGHNGQAIALYNRLLSRVDTVENPQEYAGISLNLADAYMNSGNSALAFKNYHRAIKYGDRARDSLFLATALNNLGNSYNSTDQYENAARYLQRALSLSQELNFVPGQLRSLVNLGNVRKDQGEYEAADSLYQEGLALHRKVRPDTPPIQILYNIGDLYRARGDLDEAESHFKKSLEMSRQAGVPPGIYYNTAGLGLVEKERGNGSAAVAWFEQALEMGQKLRNTAFQEEAHNYLYQAYKQDDLYAEALQHLERYKTLSDSLMTSERNEMVAEYQSRLNLEEQEQQNQQLQAESQRQESLLQMQSWLLITGIVVILIIGIFAVLLYQANREKRIINDELEQRRKELEKANETKNKLFGIVAHDLRSPLSAIIGMLDLISMDALSPEDLRKILPELQITLRQNVNSMENLLSWAKEQMAGLSVEMEEIKPHALAENIISEHSFNARKKNVALKNKIDDSLHVKADYDMLKLVIQNLISNGIKFSKEGDQVEIEATPKNGDILFEVKDSGIGIPQEIQGKIFNATFASRSGTNNEKGSGLGLHLCKEFIEKQGGQIGFDSKEGEGSRFYFTLPRSN